MDILGIIITVGTLIAIAISTGFWRLGRSIGRLEGKMDGFHDRMSSYEKQLESFDTRLHSYEKQLEGFDTRVDRLDKRINSSLNKGKD